ncbi:MAG: zf-HC2 domain-containing protein [Chloroflexi bacterium]|nr:zf-HC2 domain-containing protein [Chloroflexota bacterium]
MARITDQDLELLSAYLDGELTAAERSALDARLQREPELRRELDTLRATVGLIRALPPLKAPRDYTLDERLIRPARLWIFPATATFSAISAAAATLLLVLGVITLLTANAPKSAPSAGAPQVAAQPTQQITPTAAAASEMLALSPALTLEAAGAAANDTTSKASATITSTDEEEQAAGGADTLRQAEPGALMLPASPQQPQEAAPSIMMESAALPTGTAEFFFGAEAPAPEGTTLSDAALAQAAQPTLTATPPPTDTATPTLTLTPTTTPTLTPTVTPTPTPAVPAGTSTIGGLMLIGGLVLLGLALATTLARGRRRP